MVLGDSADVSAYIGTHPCALVCACTGEIDILFLFVSAISITGINFYCLDQVLLTFDNWWTVLVVVLLLIDFRVNLMCVVVGTEAELT